MENRIITISREYGSGGREIGRKLAEKLGIHCYDAELIQRIVEKSGYPADFVKEKGEDAVGGGISMLLVDRRLGPTHQDTLWKVQSQVISELADKESCVIVGRCADYILQARSDCLTVFIHAAFDKRVERMLKDKDKRRMAYYNYYTDKKWGNALNYHVCLDSGELGIDKCVDVLAQLY